MDVRHPLLTVLHCHQEALLSCQMFCDGFSASILGFLDSVFYTATQNDLRDELAHQIMLKVLHSSPVPTEDPIFQALLELPRMSFGITILAYMAPTPLAFLIFPKEKELVFISGLCLYLEYLLKGLFTWLIRSDLTLKIVLLRDHT